MTDEIRTKTREIMKQRKISQVELAAKTGLKADYLSKVLRGENAHVPESWQHILRELGLELVVKSKGGDK